MQRRRSGEKVEQPLLAPSVKRGLPTGEDAPPIIIAPDKISFNEQTPFLAPVSVRIAAEELEIKKPDLKQDVTLAPTIITAPVVVPAFAQEKIAKAVKVTLPHSRACASACSDLTRARRPIFQWSNPKR